MEEKDEEKIISKYSYNFIIEHRKNKYIENIELIFENYSNEKIIITLYQFIDESISIFSNTFSVDYLITQSTLMNCLYIMSKNPNKFIEKILNLIKSQFNLDKKNNSNDLIHNGKQLSFRIKNDNDNNNININNINNNNDNINLIIYITLINLQKEKIIFNLHQKNYFSYSNNNIPISLIELMEQNNNLIQDLSSMEKEFRQLTQEKNKIKAVIKKCNNYFGQSIQMKMDLMDQGIDTDIFKSKQDFIFLQNNIEKRLNKKTLEIKQIFKASSNGDNLNTLHNSCLYVSNILVIILTDKKKTFGGFTQTGFEINRYKYDPLAFLFSLDNEEIYPILAKYEKMATNCYEENFPLIFGSDIYLRDYFLSKENSIAQEGFYDYSQSKIKKDYILNDEKFFSVAELEIYQFIFPKNI